ncbi:type II toxin-antitoxin system RelE/ParE family toxin [Actinokineospora sp. HUAS TT18]|uniref:type II toxin-antitoxin system RelE/ParE family toxin n=1 Tax=Actinokineospora sp. HUAS TT18 TaxID=3447451 RepID=UPI003F526F56
MFAFDPARQAILLVAGDKAGSWTRWYTANVPVADERYSLHLRNMEGGFDR